MVPLEARPHEELTADLRKERHPLAANLFDEDVWILRAEPMEVLTSHDLEDTSRLTA